MVSGFGCIVLGGRSLSWVRLFGRYFRCVRLFGLCFGAASTCSAGFLFRPCRLPDCFCCVLERWVVFPTIHILPAFARSSVTFVDISKTKQLGSDWCTREIHVLRSEGVIF